MNNNPPRYYILVSDIENWEKSFEIETFGFSEKTKGSWNKSCVGELVAFYVMSPIKKIVGFGIITEKVIEEDLVWPDELLFERSLLKYRLKFNIIFKLDDYFKGIPVPTNLIFNQSRIIIPKELFFDLIKKSEKEWNVKIEKKIPLQIN